MMLVRQRHQRLGIRQCASGGFGMHKRQNLRVRIFLERVRDFVQVYRIAPGVLNDNRHTTETLDVFLHASAEHTVYTHDHLITRLDQIHEAGLHPRRTRRRYRHGELVPGM